VRAPVESVIHLSLLVSALHGRGCSLSLFVSGIKECVRQFIQATPNDSERKLGGNGGHERIDKLARGNCKRREANKREGHIYVYAS
jgi:hypothetical protein